jgi:hypothetical protein
VPPVALLLLVEELEALAQLHLELLVQQTLVAVAAQVGQGLVALRLLAAMVAPVS